MTTVEPRHVVATCEEAWSLYVDVFTEINRLAAQRHLMTHDEFQAVYHDTSIRKFYVRDEGGQMVGMAALTNSLAAWPLISPEYFARRWPRFYARRAIWYCGFVGARPNQLHAFRDLVTAMYQQIRSNNGMAAMDFCTYNDITRRLPEATLRLLGRLNHATTMEVADRQTFVVYRFGAGEAMLP